MEISVEIKQAVPTLIFDEPVLKTKVNKLFNNNSQQIRNRYNEVRSSIDLDDPKDCLAYEKIVEYFRIYFYKLLMNEAVKTVFSHIYNNTNDSFTDEKQKATPMEESLVKAFEPDKCNIYNYISDSLTEEKLKEAIMGEPFIKAFEYALRLMKPETGTFLPVIGSQIILLEMKFLGRKYPGA